MHLPGITNAQLGVASNVITSSRRVTSTHCTCARDIALLLEPVAASIGGKSDLTCGQVNQIDRNLVPFFQHHARLLLEGSEVGVCF